MAIELVETKSRTQLSLEQVERGLNEVGRGIDQLFDEFSTQPLDGPLNYWSLYALKSDLLKTRQSFEVIKRQYPAS